MSRSINLSALLLALLFGLQASPGISIAAGAQLPIGSWARPEIAVPVCVAPPRIDGVLNDACWKTAAHAERFYRLTSPVNQQTEAWICADSTHLYLAFHCFDDQPQSIKASETQRNGNIGVDDYVGIDIDSQNNHRGYSDFEVTARGTQTEDLEGGTADNISWAGDWRAATRRTSDGWTAEMSIPFALLRYPPGARSFGFMLVRKLARETSAEFWPDRPAISRVRPLDYYGELTGLMPKTTRPEPLFLPYVLASAGQGSEVKEGIDVKYPLSSGLTGVATVNPDFSTVEQNVTSIAFSYTQKYVSDERPFFAEGSGFLPSSDVFYSSSIGSIDGGLKVTGKEGPTSIGILAADETGPSSQFVRTMEVQQDVNSLSFLRIDYAGDNHAGLDSNQVAKAQGSYGWHSGSGLWSIGAYHGQSWVGGQEEGSDESDRVTYRGAPGHISFFVSYYGVAPNFISDVGFVPETNYKGPSFYIRQNNTFDKGVIEGYNVYATASKDLYWTGGFFQDNQSAGAAVMNRAGNEIGFDLSQGRRVDFRDHVNDVYGSWSDNSQFGGGNVEFDSGTQEDQHYVYWNVNQSYGLSETVNANLSFSWEKLGSLLTTQTVVTPQYRLTSERSIGGRIVNQNYKTDVYLVYSQKSRSGSDIYLLFGNPNSEATQGLVTVKVVTPF